MECTDLMLDDWVIDTYTGKPMRVPCVNIKVGKGLEPVPLTVDILEKNGFKNIGDDCWQLEEHPYYFWIDFFAHQYGCEYALSFDHDEHRLKLYGIPNVHDLQHALRLCGIDKEIVV